MRSQCEAGKCAHARRYHERRVEQWTSVLVNKSLPRLAQRINSAEVSIRDCDELVRVVHGHGINLQYLGMLREQVHRHAVHLS